MTNIIRYITGFPKVKTALNKKFQDISREYGLDDGMIITEEYFGPLNKEDWEIINQINTNIKLQKFIKNVMGGIFEERFSTEIKLAIASYKKGMPKKSYDLQEALNQHNIQKNYRVPVSYVHKIKNIGDLREDNLVLIFVNNLLVGELSLKITETFWDQWAGGTKRGKINLRFKNSNIKINWDWFNSETIKYTIDPLIREKFLGEKKRVFFQTYNV